jgi:hypothetical protein
LFRISFLNDGKSSFRLPASGRKAKAEVETADKREKADR